MNDQLLPTMTRSTVALPNFNVSIDTKSLDDKLCCVFYRLSHTCFVISFSLSNIQIYTFSIMKLAVITCLIAAASAFTTVPQKTAVRSLISNGVV